MQKRALQLYRGQTIGNNKHLFNEAQRKTLDTVCAAFQQALDLDSSAYLKGLFIAHVVHVSGLHERHLFGFCDFLWCRVSVF